MLLYHRLERESEDDVARDSEEHVEPVDNVRRESDRQNETIDRGRICHYYANTGQCRYEDRTGLKCKFIHKSRPSSQKVPLCQFGINCRKLRCTLSHPRVNQNWSNSGGPFLGHVDRTQFMNPWQAQFPADFWSQVYQTYQMQPNRPQIRQ